MDIKELTNQIYDTLMGNVGMSKYHVKFDHHQVSNCYVYADDGKFYFSIENNNYVLSIKINREGE